MTVRLHPAAQRFCLPWYHEGQQREVGRSADRPPSNRVLVFKEWDGLSSSAAWQDLKMGLEHLTKWNRIALVTDLDWMITVTSLFGWMTPGELKRFPVAERGAAIAWAAAAD